MRRFAIAVLLIASVPHAGLALSQSGSAMERYTLENGYVRLSGASGYFDSLRIDPSGKGRYGKNWITKLCLGETLSTASGQMRWQSDGQTLRLAKVPVARLNVRELSKREHGYPLWPGKRLGQRFRVTTGPLVRVSGFFPTWSTSGSAFTLTLRRNGPEGEIVTSQRFTDIVDAAEQTLRFPPQPAGLYYLEMTEAKGPVGWWGDNERPSEEESAFMTGPIGDEPVPVAFLTRITTCDFDSADWEVSLHDNRLRWKLAETSTPQARLVTPWIRDGYVTEDAERIVFRRVISDLGIYRPVHQFKRRERQELPVSRFAEMTSPRGFNLRFIFPQGGKLVWEMEKDAMSTVFDRPQIELEFLAHSEALSDAFPVFFSSDPKTDALLNAFYYSHALNFGVGCPPDWAEWQARILCWTKNPLRKEQAGHFTSGGYKMRPDGYVYTWGDKEGWPFPHKDEDHDGKNDYDTRHFTTNPGFVLGSARHCLWSRDRAYIEEILPRARKAMEFLLGELSGEKGIVLIPAKGHEGKAQGIGSNYWDILPFGHKDGYTNIYYYASLEAMARLEELARQMGLGGQGRAPEFYRELAMKVRRDYSANFWEESAGRFLGCVDVDGNRHDYGFTFLNLEAMGYGLADSAQAKRIYSWMENDPTASGKADCYSRWIFAPRATTIYNPPHGVSNIPPDLPPITKPSWWHFGWRGTRYDEQCQAGGAILYTSGYDILARARYLGADNAYKRFEEILGRYALPDHLSGGTPLYRGETSQGPSAGSVGVESEFPESGLVPASFLYAFLGIDADAEGLKIRPNLPSKLSFAGVRNLSYAGKTYEVRVSGRKVAVKCTDEGSTLSLEKQVAPGEVFCLAPSDAAK